MPQDPSSKNIFRINVPEQALVDLRRRVNATKWPDRETVTDESQGVQLATIQELARHWGEDCEWRRCEAKLNALPQLMTEIDGLDIRHPRQHHALLGDEHGDFFSSLLLRK
jgi:Epoxide hydrolase N terminus